VDWIEPPIMGKSRVLMMDTPSPHPVIEEQDRLGEKGPLPRVEKRGDWPLSFPQERYWFLSQFEPGNPAYNCSANLRLRGRLDASVLQRCLAEIVRRHESLRTRYPLKDARPVQRIIADCPAPLPLVDLSKLRIEDRQRAAARLVEEEAAYPFKLETGPLFRARLLRLADDEHWLLASVHISVFDDLSRDVFQRELAQLYEAFSEGRSSPLSELPIQYGEYSAWQREWLRGPELERQLGYWKSQLAGAPVLLELPLDHPRPPDQAYRGARRGVEFSRDLADRLRSLSQKAGVSLFATLLAAFQVLLSRYSGQEDVVVGSQFTGRTRAELEGMIGSFVNPYAVRNTLSGNPTFRECLATVQRAVERAQAHQGLRFARLIDELHPERNSSHSPIFQVMLVVEEPAVPTAAPAGLTITPLPPGAITTRLDLTLSLVAYPDALRGQIEYDRDLFEAATIDGLGGHFRVLLEAIADNPESRIEDLPLLTDGEQRQILVEWNETAANDGRDRCVHQLIEEQARQAPDAVAILFQSQRITYRELNARANQLACHLRQLGVAPDVRVGVCMRRTPDLIVAILAILKAGGAYVPLDPAYPTDRLAFMLEDSQASVLLTEHALSQKLPLQATHCVCLDSEWPQITRQPAEDLPSNAGPAHLAYVMYTSGSTGRPKGVAIEHRNVVNFIYSTRDVFTAEELAGSLASTSICFDLSVFELFVPLSAGGRIVLVENILALQSLPPDVDLRMLSTVPSAMPEILRVRAVPESVTSVNLIGEALATELVNDIYGQTRAARVYDLYGPTETTVYSTCTLRLPNMTATIGRPIRNTQVYVLDKHRRPVPTGVAGELYISGDGLARGYLNRPELTAERFIPCPFGSGGQKRMYRTGDLVRWRADGNLEFLGRLDHQVKLRGFRIELGEIQTALLENPAVDQCVVLLWEGGAEEKRLAAYVTPANPGAPPTAAALRSDLQKKLPDYMVPAGFVVLDAFPQTPNGKIDRKALPSPAQATPSLAADYVAPRDALEQQLASVWSEVLKLDRIGVNDNFFLLGGQSLLAARSIALVRTRFKFDLALRTVFDAPTIAGLANAMRRQLGSSPELDCQPASIIPAAPGPILRSAAEHRAGDSPGKSSAAVSEIDCAEYIEIYRPGSDDSPVIVVGDTRLVPFLLARLPASVPIYFLKLDGTHIWPPRYLKFAQQLTVFVNALAPYVGSRGAYLLGYSYGGSLAYGLAGALRKQRAVRCEVLMIEPDVPLCLRSFAERLRWRYWRLRAFLGRVRRRLWPRAGRAIAAASEALDPAALAPTDGEARWRLMEAFYGTSTAKAKPLRSPGRIALVGTRHYHSQHALSWRKVSTGGLDCCVLSTDEKDHNACFQEPYVSQLLDFAEAWYARPGRPVRSAVAEPSSATVARPAGVL
jgi:amino acid adenylation domain-containing protein